MKPKNIEAVKAGRKRDAVRSVALFAILQSGMAAFMVWLCFLPDCPRWASVLFGVIAALSLGMIIPALLLLKQRFKEIEGGEQDAAAEY